MIQRQLSIAQMTAVGEQRLHRCDGITSIVLQDLGHEKSGVMRRLAGEGICGHRLPFAP